MKQAILGRLAVLPMERMEDMASFVEWANAYVGGRAAEKRRREEEEAAASRPDDNEVRFVGSLEIRQGWWVGGARVLEGFEGEGWVKGWAEVEGDRPSAFHEPCQSVPTAWSDELALCEARWSRGCSRSDTRTDRESNCSPFPQRR